jgi:hypothetical protein
MEDSVANCCMINLRILLENTELLDMPVKMEMSIEQDASDAHIPSVDTLTNYQSMQ